MRRIAILLSLLSAVALADQSPSSLKATDPPTLDGQHFRVTAIPAGSFLALDEEWKNPSGYLIDMIQEIAKEANFTYELLTPSGLGSDCVPRLANTTESEAYSSRYRMQYNCGTNDVNELQGTKYATDIYLGMYYRTTQRSLSSWFTVPFQPPYKGTPAMFGTTTGIESITRLVEEQAKGSHPPACVRASSATLTFVQESFPELQIRPYVGNEDELYDKMNSGECPIAISDAPIAAQYTLLQSQKGNCLAGGRPIGMIGEPMKYGLSHYAIGVGKHNDREVVDTLSYWMDMFMMDGRLAEFYTGQGGTGKECGYVLYPPPEENLSGWGIAGVVLGAVALVFIPMLIWHRLRLKRQEARYKKRFVQQIARNIDIGRRPGCIPAEKLSEEVLHIGKGKDYIKKDDLSQWMHDIKLNFISKRDFDALWNAMDIDGTGTVDAVEFIVFLSACGPEFEEVYEEQSKMPKLERLKLAARRLSVISLKGEQGVRDIERKLESSSRGTKPRSSISSHSDASGLLEPASPQRALPSVAGRISISNHSEQHQIISIDETSADSASNDDSAV